MIRYDRAAVIVLAMSLGSGLAHANGEGRDLGLSVSEPVETLALNSETPQGQGLVSGSAGSTQSVMVPGSPVNGTLMNNGNGTSSMMVPGQASQTVPAPR
jgi:hypothetical protein